MPSWQDALKQEKSKAYYHSLMVFVASERSAGKKIYPQDDDVFNALTLTPLDKVKVVILGQDPYHGANQAQGLSFSVGKGIPHPPSLKNMFKELEQDNVDFQTPIHGDLTPWANQGVLLLNTVLTVEDSQPNSHANKGWEEFTDSILEVINDHTKGTVFLLWGAHAQKKAKRISNNTHCILKGPHPSPLSAYRGFFGCKHFSQTNALLADQGKSPINWNCLN